MTGETKRLFLGLSIDAPWPEAYPKGRILEEASRHITLAFLGNHPYERIEPLLEKIPLPKFPTAPTGICDALSFLPKHHPRVAAYHASWWTRENAIAEHYKKLTKWLQTEGFKVDSRPYNAHLTVARAPFDQESWKNSFEPLPFVATGFHLYESIRNLTYLPLWSHPFLAPFEEFEHTADIAFHIRGVTLEEVLLHATIALSFYFPPFHTFLKEKKVENLEEIIEHLNQMVTMSDVEVGCPFKAVSYHGEIQETSGLLHWEMIVDV